MPKLLPEIVHTIQYVACELPPLGFGLFGADDTPGELRAEYLQLPDDWATAPRFLAGDVDRARCENDCGSPIGYYLDDVSIHWRITYLAKLDDRGIVRLCENCSPACPVAAPALRADPRS